MKVITDESRIDEVLRRGVTEVIVQSDLKKKLLSGERLRIKLGIDPTSPNIHLGRAVTLLKLRDFAELGHQIVFIVGDFTGVIGDTSDKDSERPMLAKDTIESNKKSYFEQVGKILDIDQCEMRYNSEWLSELTYREIGEHANQFSVSDFIARENIKKRLDQGTRVSLREVLYPLMQGYDSVAIEADVEVGGTDQRFNLLAGRTLQEGMGQEAQNVVITGPLLPGTDGRKMSSSWGNTINITDAPNDMFGKIMSVHDELIGQYFELCTRLPRDEIQEVLVGSSARDAKARLAREIVSLYHGESAGSDAEAAFEKTFSKKELPEDMPEVSVEAGENFVDVLIRVEIVKSKSDFRRLITEGAVTNRTTGEKITSLDTEAAPGVYQIGKRRFVKII